MISFILFENKIDRRSVISKKIFAYFAVFEFFRNIDKKKYFGYYLVISQKSYTFVADFRYNGWFRSSAG